MVNANYLNPNEYTPDEVQSVRESLEDAGYHVHHSATAPGYISRRIGCRLDFYHGHFGTGYILRQPRHPSTGCHNITYYVR